MPRFIPELTFLSVFICVHLRRNSSAFSSGFFAFDSAGHKIACMNFQIATLRSFSAAHQLRLYDGSLEPLHGHNWKVRIVVAAAALDSIGVVMDFHELERLADDVIGPIHNTHLNDLPAFGRLNPSAENVALYIGRSLRLPDHVTLESVEVWETEGNSAIYRP
jgi:6-pyruvoyltetrahydropterin/6-carboxytetrahydropterin synthase